MSDSLQVRPVLSGTAEHRKASSSCCGAKLAVYSGDEGTSSWECRECGRPCDLVLGDPQEVTLHG